jgi:hypothetical protein
VREGEERRDRLQFVLLQELAEGHVQALEGGGGGAVGHAVLNRAKENLVQLVVLVDGGGERVHDDQRVLRASAKKS